MKGVGAETEIMLGKFGISENTGLCGKYGTYIGVNTVFFILCRNATHFS